jgi:hypothetical protein
MMTVLVVVVRNLRNAMEKMHKLLVVLCFMCATHISVAQVSVDIDQKIEENLRMKNASMDSLKVSGYRIQIAFSTSQSVVMDARAKFQRLFPDYYSRTYPLYQQPYWKMRVADFYREVDAIAMLDDIRVYFPNALLVRDYIRRPLIE